MVAYADCEPAIDDDRLTEIAEKCRVRYYPHLEDSDFFTARVLNPAGVMEVHFQIQTLYPKEPQRSLGVKHGSLGRTTAKDWDASEKERAHYANKLPDPAERFFMALGQQHVKQLQDLRDLITDDIDRKRVVFDVNNPSLLLN